MRNNRFKNPDANLLVFPTSWLRCLISNYRKTQTSLEPVAAERNSPYPFCHYMLSIVSLHKKLPIGNFGIFPIVPKGKGAFIWKWGTPGNDWHSLWTI